VILPSYIRGVNFFVYFRRSPHIVGGRLPQGLTRDFVGSLRAQRVFISQRGSSIRIAPHLHVTEPDIEQLFAALDVVAPSVSSS